MRSGVCVKKCPTGEDVTSAAWWTENCKSNEMAACPTGVTDSNGFAPYDAFDFITYCLPNPISGNDNQDFISKLKDEFLSSEAGAVFTNM